MSTNDPDTDDFLIRSDLNYGRTPGYGPPPSYGGPGSYGPPQGYGGQGGYGGPAVPRTEARIPGGGRTGSPRTTAWRIGLLALLLLIAAAGVLLLVAGLRP